MNKQITIASAKLAEECECLGVFVQLVIENLAAALEVETSWLVAVERALADYGLKVVDAGTGRGDAP